MIDFKKLKENRQNVTAKFAEMEKANTNKGGRENYWKVNIGKDKMAVAVIRFLMPTKGEDFPYVKVFQHNFEGPGGFFWQNCPTTIGKECSVCEANKELWNSGVEENSKLASTRKRKAKYTFNILVVDDKKEPENNGKVFLFECGQQIYDKIKDAISPEPESGEEPIDVFDFWSGANFKLVLSKGSEKGAIPKYDKSAFLAASQIAKTDDEIEKIWNMQHSLSTLIADDKFLSYEDLDAKFKKATGKSKVGSKRRTVDEDEEEIADEPASVAKLPKGKAKPVSSPAPFDTDEDEGDSSDVLSKFKNLLNED